MNVAGRKRTAFSQSAVLSIATRMVLSSSTRDESLRARECMSHSSSKASLSPQTLACTDRICSTMRFEVVYWVGQGLLRPCL